MAHRARLVNDALAGAAHSSSVTWVDGASVMARTGREGWHVDRIHPSPTGHRALASEALRLIEDRWPRVADVAPAPAPPSPAHQAWWMVRHGTPWALKRSKDLIPALVALVAADWVIARQGRRQPKPPTP